MRHRLGSALAGGALLITSLISVVPGPPALAQTVAAAGVYSGPAVPAGVADHDSFATWLGTSVPYAVEFLDTYGSWEQLANPSWALDNWSEWVQAQPGRRLVLSVPLLVSGSSGQLAQGASGAFDAHFRTLAQNMVSRKLGSSVIRLGWEMNNSAFPWWAGKDPASFRSFYAKVVSVMRSVPGAAFTFDWNPNLGVQGGSTLTTFESFYPGDAYVDVIGLDIYDIKWGDATSTPAARWDWMVSQTLGLQQHRSFAAAHAKPVSFPEWGLYKAGDQMGGGGDNPAFVDSMANWIASGNTLYQSYFDDDWGGGSLATFPKAQAQFKVRFGADVIPTVSIRSAAVAEGQPGQTARAEFTLSLSAPAAGPVTVRAATANGTATAGSDYTALAPTTIGFAAGETTKKVSVAVTGDSVAEGNETLLLNLSSPVGAVLAPAKGVGTILDEEGPPTISVANATVPEGPAGQVTSAGFTLSLSSPAAGPVSVKAATANGTASAGSDYTALPLTTVSFATGETTKKVSVPVTGDSVAEGNEAFLLNLTSPVGAVLADAQGLGTIHDEEGPPAISVSNASVVEGAPGGTATAGFTVSLSAPAAGPVSVRAATANGTAVAGSDYTALAPTTVSFAVGETTKTVSVPVPGDSVAEGNETFVLNLSSPVGAVLADAQGLGTVVEDEGLLGLLLPAMPPPSVSVSNATVVEGAPGATASAVFKVSLSAPVPLLGTIKVNVATANGTATAGSDYTALAPTTLTFTTGETTKTVLVPVTGDAVAEGDETFRLNLSSPAGAVLADTQGLATILDEEGSPAISVSDATVVEGAGATSARFTLSLSAPAAVVVSVHVATANGTATAGSDYTALALTAVSFAPGETAKVVSIPVSGDSIAEGNETFVLNLSSNRGAVLADSRGLGTVVNDD